MYKLSTSSLHLFGFSKLRNRITNRGLYLVSNKDEANNGEAEVNDKNFSNNTNLDKQQNFTLDDFAVKRGVETPLENLEKMFELDSTFKNQQKDGLADQREYDVEDSMWKDVLLLKMKKEKLIDSFQLYVKGDNAVTQDKIIELLTSACNLHESDKTGNIVYVDSEGEKEFPKEIRDTVLREKVAEALLPEINLDVTQSGDVRRAKEVQAMYKLSVLNAAFGYRLIDQIKDVLAGYDVKLLNKNDKTFAGLLRDVLEQLPTIAQSIATLCNVKISLAKADRLQKINLKYTQEEDTKLRSLLIDIASLRLKEGDRINNLETKAERQVERDKLEEEIKTMAKRKGIEVIYTISKLSADDVNDRAYAKMNLLVNKLGVIIEEREGLSDCPDFVRKIKQQLRRRCFRQYIQEWAKQLYNTYTETGEFEIEKKAVAINSEMVYHTKVRRLILISIRQCERKKLPSI